jgi:hypothetical protein
MPALLFLAKAAPDGTFGEYFGNANLASFSFRLQHFKLEF